MRFKFDKILIELENGTGKIIVEDTQEQLTILDSEALLILAKVFISTVIEAKKK